MPVELWDAVFHEISDADLLRTAIVCRAFNTLCITIYLARHHISGHSLSSGNLSISSHILRALGLSCDTRPITRLVCHFWSFGVRQNLASLQDLLRRSTSLQQLILTFSLDPLENNFYNRMTPSLQRDLLRTFCAMLSTMAIKTPGPVVLGFGHRFFMCRAKDIAGWRLDTFQFNRARGPCTLITRMRRALCNTSPSMPHTTVRLPSGTKSRQSTLTEIKSVDILSLRDDPGPFRSYTIIIFNIQSLTNLTFWGGADMPVEQVSAMLPHLTLPALRHLTLRIDGIDSTSLGDFLLRNTALETLAFRPWGEAEPKHTRWISPPIAHPGLTQISASGADNINGLMKCLHRSPLLGNFDYTLSETENLIALNPTFRLLSHRSRDADLALSIYGVEGSDEPFADEEAANIARALHCIPSVEIRCWSARLALKTLPWLVLFPGLRHVTFCLYIRGWAPRRNSDDPELQAELAMLIHEATATLSQVQEIDGEVR